MAIDLQQIQHTIGYKFDNVDLLQQAFVRRSYSEENGGQNNEVLEFIGDKALDLAVIRVMMERFGHITEEKEWSEFKLRNPKYFQTRLKEGNFTDIKKDLVEKKALANSMNDLGFQTQLIMGNGDIQENVQEQDSVKEDLFEAIIGAVALDSNWDMDAITDVVERMIDFDAYFNNEVDENQNYVGLVQTWFQKNGLGLPDYRYQGQNGDYSCWLILDFNGRHLKAYGEGTSQAKARMATARNAYDLLEENGYILNQYKEAVGNADYDRASAQINELYQKKLINKPNYEFTQQYNEDGNSIWECVLIIDGVDESFVNEDTNKKDAQRASAYDMLLYLMDEYEDEEDETEYDDYDE